MRRFLSLFLLSFFLLNCSSDSSDFPDNNVIQEEETNNDESSTSFNKTGLLTNLSDNMIIPYYEQLYFKISDFYTIVLANTDMEFNLGTIRNYRDWYDFVNATWQRASIYNFGPAIDLNLRDNVNSYPLDVVQLTQNVESGIYDLSAPQNTFAKGFPAIEYLLNIGDSDSETEQILNGPNREAYYAYLVAVLEDLEQLFGTVLGEWRSSYRDTFIAATQNSSTGSINIVANEMIRNFEEEIRFKKIGNPIGVCTGVLNPDLLETPHSSFDFSKQWSINGMLGIIELFNGLYFIPETGSANGLSFDDYLNFMSDMNGTINADAVNSCLNGSTQLMSDVSISFREDILNNGGANLQLIYNECGACINLMKDQMLSALDINLNYTYVECN